MDIAIVVHIEDGRAVTPHDCGIIATTEVKTGVRARLVGVGHRNLFLGQVPILNALGKVILLLRVRKIRIVGGLLPPDDNRVPRLVWRPVTIQLHVGTKSQFAVGVKVAVRAFRQIVRVQRTVGIAHLNASTIHPRVPAGKSVAGAGGRGKLVVGVVLALILVEALRRAVGSALAGLGGLVGQPVDCHEDGIEVNRMGLGALRAGECERRRNERYGVSIYVLRFPWINRRSRPAAKEHLGRGVLRLLFPRFIYAFIIRHRDVVDLDRGLPHAAVLRERRAANDRNGPFFILTHGHGLVMEDHIGKICKHRIEMNRARRVYTCSPVSFASNAMGFLKSKGSAA